MRQLGRLLCLGAVLLIAASSVSAQTIKMGTLVPAGSTWDRNLKILAADWARATDGQVRLKIYAGGRAGDEPDMLRKLRFNQLQAAGLSLSGMGQVFEGVLAPATPMLVQNNDELDYVLEKMRPLIEKEFEKKGFKILFWNKAGWAHFFSRDPIVYPSDLRPQKLWVMEGNVEESNAWKKLGFRAVTFETLDLMVQLQSGGLDALVSSPIIAAANQWFGIADNMAEFKWAPFYGAFIMNLRTWRRIPERYHEAILEAGRECGRRMDRDTAESNREALEVMRRYGLSINPTTPDAIEEWKEFVRRGLDVLVGDRFDISVYQLARKYIDEYRRDASR